MFIFYKMNTYNFMNRCSCTDKLLLIFDIKYPFAFNDRLISLKWAAIRLIVKLWHSRAALSVNLHISN